ncbi:hypothetical protein chiPu_0024321 [Chiloscyllium punctatum]|uniref:Uncharacterized protein n=1 Tax=Chiloscyllium punctatum TaxID=137246 RepID=A0A401TCE8_CHIPU|nr:hypothetical protein [Chiloscyllium punctatum]
MGPGRRPSEGHRPIGSESRETFDGGLDQAAVHQPRPPPPVSGRNESRSAFQLDSGTIRHRSDWIESASIRLYAAAGWKRRG